MPTISAPGDDTTRLASVGDLDATEVISDARPGYLAQVTPQQRALWAAIQQQRERNAEALQAVTPAAREAARIQREAEARRRAQGDPRELLEAEAEARRRAQGDPRELLEAAHAALAASEDEAERLNAAATKARSFRDEAEARLRETERALEQANAIAAGRLIASFTGSGGETGPIGPESGPTVRLDEAKRSFEVAETALARLEADLAAAKKLIARRRAEVRRATHALLTDLACDRADRILDLDFRLQTERADLQALAFVLSNMGRSNFTASPPLPAKVSRAAYPPDPQHGGARTQPSTDWQTLFNELASDPAAALPDDEAIPDEATAA